MSLDSCTSTTTPQLYQAKRSSPGSLSKCTPATSHDTITKDSVDHYKKPVVPEKLPAGDHKNVDDLCCVSSVPEEPSRTRMHNLPTFSPLMILGPDGGREEAGVCQGPAPPTPAVLMSS